VKDRDGKVMGLITIFDITGTLLDTGHIENAQ
jgi:hypothetical protein